jgi:hypothetical protein
MRRLLCTIMSLAAAACASAPPPGPLRVTLPDVSGGELIGRDQDQVRIALGAPAGEGSLLFNTASAVDGALFVSIHPTALFAAAGPCPDGYNLFPIVARPQGTGINSFVFRDNRLDHIVGGSNPPAPLPTEATLVRECYRRGVSTTGSAAGDAITGVGAIIWFAPLIGVALAGAAVGSTMDESDERRHALSVIRLGEPLPGGVDAYVAAHPHAVAVVQRHEESAELTIALWETSDPRRLFGISVQAGMVQSVRAPGSSFCRIRHDGEIECPR